jgi:hypothetical protein
VTLSLWVPGRFRLTNDLLSDLRGAGRYEGLADGKGWGKPRPGCDLYANHQQAVRLAVKAAARGCGTIVGPVSLLFYLWGHGKGDPSAWYLIGKAAEDGLVDAGVLISDRFCVLDTGGAVVSVEREPYWRHALNLGPDDARGPGLWILIVEA